MRILIFSETDQAKELAKKLRGEGKRASLRNPQFFSDHPSQFEKADKVFCESDEIERVYKEAKVEVERLDKKAEKPAPKPKAKPRAKRKPKGKK